MLRTCGTRTARDPREGTPCPAGIQVRDKMGEDRGGGEGGVK